MRERFAEEAPKVVIVCDRRPQMAHFASPLPWLDKPRAMRHTVELVLASARRSGGFVGYLDYADGDPHWRPAEGRAEADRAPGRAAVVRRVRGPPDWLERSIAHLASHRRSVSAGTFVFVLSDFIPPPPAEVWLTAVENRWDLVPVVIQDPTWEQSFPDVTASSSRSGTPRPAGWCRRG